jgi:hypothetical protein
MGTGEELSNSIFLEIDFLGNLRHSIVGGVEGIASREKLVSGHFGKREL